MAYRPQLQKFAKSGKQYRSLEEILAPTDSEVHNATAAFMNRYDKLADEFKSKTALTDLDLTIMMFCAGMQVLRWYIFSNETMKFDTAAQADRAVKKYLPKSVYEVIAGSVPYDAIRRSAHFTMKYPGESLGISGANHRIKTLGHDLVAGWIVGTANIATNTLTVNDWTLGFPSYYVNHVNEIDDVASFPEICLHLRDELAEKPSILATSFLKQSVHFGSDFFTKQGLPLPIINVLSPEMSKYLMGQDMRIDSWSVIKSAGGAMLINKFVEMFHRLWFDPNRDNEHLYEVRTRKIIVYSNTLASILNTGYVAASKDFRKLDIGGIAVALWRLFTDTAKIRQIRAEFIEKTLSDELKKEEDEINEKLAQYGYRI